MMEKKHFSLTYCAKILPFEAINEQFTKCKCYVQALGKNRNLTHFSKENVLKALPTLFNIPVIGHIIEDKDGHMYMGGHDAEVVVSEDGSLGWKSVCVPYGVVPQQDDVRFEYLMEPDGVMREYLAVDIILWTGRFPELKEVVYSDDIYFNQSMEIVATSWKPLEDDHNYLDVVDYLYSALCLLGKADDTSSAEHTEPCFPLASVQPYEYNMQSESFIEMVGQLRDELASCFAQKESQKGGNAKDMSKEMIDAILKEFGLTAERINMEISDETTEDDVRAAAQAYMDENSDADSKDESAAENGAEPEEPEQKDEDPEDGADNQQAESFSLTARAKSELMTEALNALSYTETDEDGRWIADVVYYLADFDDKFVYAEKYEWNSDEGSKHVIYCRVAYTVDDARKELHLSTEIEPMVVYWLTTAEAEEVDRKRGEYEELRTYKSNKEAEELKNEMDSVLSEFADIAGADEFAGIRENPYRFASAEELRIACFAVRGMIAQPKSKTSNNIRCPVILSDDKSNDPNDSRYGDLFDRFGYKNK